MLQQFYHIEPFRNAILRLPLGEIEQMPGYQGESVDDDVLYQLQKLFIFLQKTDRQDYNPKDFCFSFKDYAGNPTNLVVQQDAQEFLNMIFEKLENKVKGGVWHGVLENVFGGKYCNQMICKECGNVSDRFENFYNLSLQVKFKFFI